MKDRPKDRLAGLRLRSARREDAADLVAFIRMAGDGVPEFVWAGMAGPQESIEDVGARRAARDEGGFSWRNATLACLAGEDSPAAGLIGYPLPDVFDPDEISATPPVLRPLAELEALAPASWYVNVLATRPDCRRLGLGRRLMAVAAERAAAAGCARLSLIVSSGKAEALALYASEGFRPAGVRAKHPDGPLRDGPDWHLLIRAL